MGLIGFARTLAREGAKVSASTLRVAPMKKQTSPNESLCARQLTG